MKNYQVYWGETFDFLVEINDPNAISATLVVKTDPVISRTDVFVDGIADCTILAEDLEILTGTYDYQLIINYDNRNDKLPDNDECDGDCELPTITICPSADMPEEFLNA